MNGPRGSEEALTGGNASSMYTRSHGDLWDRTADHVTLHEQVWQRAIDQ